MYRRDSTETAIYKKLFYLKRDNTQCKFEQVRTLYTVSTIHCFLLQCKHRSC